jgi:hypothetical protein
VKSPVGIEFGVDYQLGNFDECMRIQTDRNADGVSIKPKYCLLEVNIEGYDIREAATRNREASSNSIIQARNKSIVTRILIWIKNSLNLHFAHD